MDIRYIEDPVPHIIIENMYTEDELKLIWCELEYYRLSNNFILPKDSFSARDENGNPLKNNLCINLDGYYKDRNFSSILKLNRKLWENEAKELAETSHWALEPMSRCNSDNTLLSYYENEHYYDFHRDAYNVTAVTHFYKEPKQFSGGDLLLNDDSYNLSTVNNRCIIFPSSVPHSVTKIQIEEDKRNQGYGRWTMSQFMRYRS